MPASDPTLTAFTAGDLVISVSGDGDGSGDYGDNQASPITLDEVTTSGSLVGDLVLPQTTTVVNGTTEYAISGEYGSSSEGSLALSVDGQSLVIMGYGISAGTFNTGGAAVYGNAALAQSTSVLGGIYTAVPRVVADIGYNTTVDTSTALYDIDNTNNPRSVATVNGTNFYVSGQGKKGDTTQGVFEAADGADGATPIDTSTDTRNVEIFDGELYVSRDSTQGTGGTSNIASYGTLLPTGATTATVLPGIDGTVTLTAAQENTVNGSAVGTTIHLSPENFFFADPTTLYIADGGNPKEGGLGDGGLQKWVFNGTSWVLEYTLSAGLNLVPDTATSGTTGLIGLTGTVVGGVAELYATNSTIGDLDQTYLFGITDTLAATSGAGESFTTLVTAATDTNIRGVSFAPTSATTTPADITVSGGPPQSGLIVTSGSTLTVLSGGTVTSTTVMSGGLLVVSSGGIDLAGTIAHGGSATVIGSAGGDQIDGTQLVSGANAVVSDEYVYNGGAVDLFLKGDVASGLILTNGGVLNISGNAEALNTVISGGGTVDLQSPKATLGGSLTFLGSGTLETTALISSGFGDLAVISGFGSGDVVDAVIGSGLTLTTAAVSGTTVATVSGTGGSETFIFAGSIGSVLSLTSDGHGGDEIIYSVPVSNTIVSSGSSQPNLTVSSGSTLTVLSGGTIVGATIFAGGLAVVSGLDSASVISSGGNETILGSATGDQIYGTQLVSAATAVVSGETVFNGGFVDLYLKGGVASGLTVSGGGTLNISGNATAINTVLTGGGVLDLQSPKANVTGSLTFSGAGTLEETDVVSAGFGDLAVISGFRPGDVIDVSVIGTGGTLTGTVVSGNTVETITSGTVSEAFTFAGLYTSGYFTLVADSGSGVMVTANGTPCYCPGTLILTDRGEVAVERLRIGDRVVTVSGVARPIRWIGRRSYDGRFAAGQKHILPVRIAAGALADVQPRRDMMVSPLHAMFIDGVLIPAASLCNGSSIRQLDSVDSVHYFHVELDSHDIILAEGAPAETFVDDDSRGMFHNAAEYRALYPKAASVAAHYCAPRVEDGEALECVRRRLAARLSPAGVMRVPGDLQGYLDEAGRDRIRGWAFEPDGPHTPVRLRIFDNGAVIGEVIADRYREDLAKAGIGNGCHGFELIVAGGLSPAVGHVIEVVRSADGRALSNSPWITARRRQA